MRSSAECREWWPHREVARKLSGMKGTRHRSAGMMTFERTSFTIDDGSDKKLQSERLIGRILRSLDRGGGLRLIAGLDGDLAQDNDIKPSLLAQGLDRTRLLA
jgi:hypothetical protein